MNQAAPGKVSAIAAAVIAASLGAILWSGKNSPFARPDSKACLLRSVGGAAGDRVGQAGDCVDGPAVRAGLPGAEALDVHGTVAALDWWAEVVLAAERKYRCQYDRDPDRYDKSLGQIPCGSTWR